MNTLIKLNKYKIKAAGLSCTYFNIKKASRILSKVYNDAFIGKAVKGTQYSLLMTIAYYPGTTLSRNIGVLERRKFIRTESPDGGGNQKKLYITPLGEEVLLYCMEEWEKTQKLVQQKIGKNRWRELIRLLLLLQREFS
jgi:DNA-binding MarR family transcriptional regulator